MSIIKGIQTGFTESFTCAVDLGKGVAYTLDSNGKAIAGTVTNRLGYTLEDRKAGQTISCTVPGQVIEETASGSIAPMNYVVPDATTPASKVSAFTPVPGGATNKNICGIAITPAVNNAKVRFCAIFAPSINT